MKILLDSTLVPHVSPLMPDDFPRVVIESGDGERVPFSTLLESFLLDGNHYKHPIILLEIVCLKLSLLSTDYIFDEPTIGVSVHGTRETSIAVFDHSFDVVLPYTMFPIGSDPAVEVAKKWIAARSNHTTKPVNVIFPKVTYTKKT